MKKLLCLGLSIASVAVLAACGSESARGIQTSKSSTHQTQRKSSAGWNSNIQTYTGSNVDLKIDNLEKATDAEGKPTLVLHFTLTDKSAGEQTLQFLYQGMIDAYQEKDGALQRLAFNAASSDQGESHLQDTVKDGQTLSGYYVYTIDETASKLVFDFRDSYMQTSDKFEVPLSELS